MTPTHVMVEPPHFLYFVIWRGVSILGGKTNTFPPQFSEAMSPMSLPGPKR